MSSNDGVGVAAVAESDIPQNDGDGDGARDGQARPSVPIAASSTDGPNIELDEEAALQGLTENVRDQDALERDITVQANEAFIRVEDEKDQKRIERLEQSKVRLQNQLRNHREKFRTIVGNPPSKRKLEQDIARIVSDIKLIDVDIADFNERIEQRHKDDGGAQPLGGIGNKRMPNESQREFLLRTGKITPFSKFGGPRPEGVSGDLADAMIDAEEEAAVEQMEEGLDQQAPRSHQNLRLPGFAEEPGLGGAAVESEFSLRPRKKRKVEKPTASDEEFDPTVELSDAAAEEEFAVPEDDSGDALTKSSSVAKKKRKRTKAVEEADGKVDLSKIDDGNETVYQARLADWVERRSRARRGREERGQVPEENPGDEEWFKPSPDQPDHNLEYGLKLPGDVYPALFEYQKTGVQWLAELYDQEVGGIVGDEMGLGKTVQLISFVTALHYSRKLDKPVIVVAPATVMQQWVNEFHRWWPPLRVSILHSSGSGMMNVRNEGRIEDYDDFEVDEDEGKVYKTAKKIVDRVVRNGHVLVTTYAGLQTYGDLLTSVHWGYAVLDEGHKIRNPNAILTTCCKELRTHNRIILSGTPIQNNLTELWSLFDFVFPMRLGNLVDFRNQFEVPIKMGGYANATKLQIMTAQKCAEKLKETIAPYLLQRLKSDVAADLPKKNEQVIFCKLTRHQQQSYELYLTTNDVQKILNRDRNSLPGIDTLRKICNHPDLTRQHDKPGPHYKWGDPAKSGKMQVVRALLQTWKKFGHKTLLFCQTVQMLDILQADVQRQEGIKYLRMDGKTPIKERQVLVDKFNNDPSLDVFLMTTRVGGLGVNLTGANRVIIFDPDWNPSTDVQARERAWRLGQKREVVIYRLMTAGTIEEKIYHRQIFKQFISNKVLKDPKLRTTFNFGSLHDLFTLGSTEGGTETSQMFKGAEVSVAKSPNAHASPRQGNDQGPSNQGPGEEDELRHLAGVAALEEYKDDDGKAPNEEDRLMEGIFAQSGVHSALEHEKIVNGRKVVQADAGILRQEANRVAAEAEAHLRRAGERARAVPIGTVTWTGEVGESGRPSNVRRGRAGVGSAAVLAGSRDRQGIGAPGSAGSSRAGTPGATATAQRNLKLKDFQRLIVEYIRSHGGRAPSKMLVDHFNPVCQTKRQIEDFKTALDRVAKMEKSGVGSSLRSVWTLKPGVH